MPKCSRRWYEKKLELCRKINKQNKKVVVGSMNIGYPPFLLGLKIRRVMITIHDGDVTADHRSCMLQQGYEIK